MRYVHNILIIIYYIRGICAYCNNLCKVVTPTGLILRFITIIVKCLKMIPILYKIEFSLNYYLTLCNISFLSIPIIHAKLLLHFIWNSLLNIFRLYNYELTIKYKLVFNVLII